MFGILQAAAVTVWRTTEARLVRSAIRPNASIRFW